MSREEAIADLMLAQADVSYRPKDDSIDLAIIALENQKSIIEELERYKKMYSKLIKSKNKLKKTIQDNLLKNELFIRAYYFDSTSGFIIETQKIIDSHFDKYIKEKKE